MKITVAASQYFCKYVAIYAKIAKLMSNASILKSTLRDSGQSTTKTRLEIFKALETHGPCSLRTLQDITAQSLHRASVYRTVQLFESLGIVQRIPIGWKYKLELSDIFSDHHHHAHCSKCEKLIKLKEHEEIERAIEEIARANGLRITSHSLEIHGLCSTCS